MRRGSAASWPGPEARFAVALLAWLPFGIVLAATVGLPGSLVLTLPLQLAGVVLAGSVPRLAWLGAAGLAGLVLLWVPLAAVVAVARAPGLTLVSVTGLGPVAWLAGAVLAATGRIVRLPWLPGPGLDDAPWR